jgi:hypothetical protein
MGKGQGCPEENGVGRNSGSRSEDSRKKRTDSMNIFQKRHRLLEKHRGERFTPAQLKAEFLNTFPAVNPSSINAADCFNTPTKKAGCTFIECTKLGGFAVNRDGIVDMGASGWSEISSVYTPTGHTRTATQRAVVDATFSQPRMTDPLSGFGWNNVCARYDAACRGFSSLSPHLRVGHRPIVHKPPDTAPPVPETYARVRFAAARARLVPGSDTGSGFCLPSAVSSCNRGRDALWDPLGRGSLLYRISWCARRPTPGGIFMDPSYGIMCRRTTQKRAVFASLHFYDVRPPHVAF